ncbi:MAG: DUF2062 domain-containing protein [Verrucomicrobiota bacterium]
MTLKIARWMEKRGISRRRLKGGRLHRVFGNQLLDPKLWQLKRVPVARAWLIAVIAAASPFLGFHMVIAVLIALICRANVPVSMALVWINNPVTMLVYYPAAYWFGCQLLEHRHNSSINWHVALFNLNVFRDVFFQIWQPLILGCTVIGFLFGVMGYALILLLWRPSLDPISSVHKKKVRLSPVSVENLN